MANRYVRATGGNSNAAGTWEETPGGGETVAVPTNSDDVFLVVGSGQLTINAQLSCKTFNCSGYTNTLTHGAFALVAAGSVTFVSGMTYTISSALAVIQFIVGATLTTAGKTMPYKIDVAGGAFVLADNITFGDYQTAQFVLRGTSHNLSGRTISGYSTTSRLLIHTNTLGTSKPMTIDGSSVFVNCDFMDIAASAAIDLSGATGLSGNCGGNTNITFTTAVEQTWSGATGNWSNSALWTSRVPLPQDNVVIPNPGAASRTLTADMPRLGKDITVTNDNATNKPTLSVTSQDVTLYGSLTFVTSTYLTTSITKAITFAGRSNSTITTAGHATFTGITVACYGATLTAQDAITIDVGAKSFTLTTGTFDANGFAITTGGVSSRNSNTRHIKLGNGNWTLTNTSTSWDFLNSGTGLTVTLGTGKIIFSGASGTKNFWGASKTWCDIDFTTGAGTLSFNRYDTDTIGVLTVTGSGTVQLEPSKTLTVGGFAVTGVDSSHKVTLNSRTAGSAATISKSSGIVSVDYMIIQDSTATGGATWYAGANSTNTSNNNGWIFTDVPGAAATVLLTQLRNYINRTRNASPFSGSNR